MTLIVSAATRRAAYQVADAQLTLSPTGTVADDLAPKTVIVLCHDAKLIISYSGLASLDGLRTDRWLAQLLVRLDARSLVFLEVLEGLRTALNHAITSNPHLETHGLSLAICG